MSELEAPPAAVRATTAIVSSLKAPASAKAVMFALLQVSGGAIEATLPNGDVLRFGDASGPAFKLRVKDYRFARRVLMNGDIGFAEGWMNGEWETDDLSGLLTLLASNIERFTRVFEGRRKHDET